MAKALLGTHATPRAVQLLDEVRALRARVAELEAQLARAESMHQERVDIVDLDSREPVSN